jgi:hypothetical protein
MIPPSSDDDKKKARAERFAGLSGASTGSSEEDKKNLRLARFGMNDSAHYNLDTGRVITNSMANKRVKDN